jgi:hypothetical protein
MGPYNKALHHALLKAGCTYRRIENNDHYTALEYFFVVSEDGNLLEAFTTDEFESSMQ